MFPLSLATVISFYSLPDDCLCRAARTLPGAATTTCVPSQCLQVRPGCTPRALSVSKGVPQAPSANWRYGSPLPRSRLLSSVNQQGQVKFPGNRTQGPDFPAGPLWSSCLGAIPGRKGRRRGWVEKLNSYHRAFGGGLRGLTGWGSPTELPIKPDRQPFQSHTDQRGDII